MCVLWQNAVNKAQERGLQMERKCPLDQICKGDTCMVLGEPKESEVEQKTDIINLGC